MSSHSFQMPNRATDLEPVSNMRLIRAHDGVAFDFPQDYIFNIHSLSALLELISPEIQIEPNEIILMNALGSQLSDGLLKSILRPEQSPSPSTHSIDSSNLLSLKPSPARPSTALLYAFDRRLVSADPSETLDALACEAENVLDPPLPSFDSTNSDLHEINNLALSHFNVGSNHLRTTLLLLSHVRAQKSALEVALNNLDKCREPPGGALEAFETFSQPLVQDYGKLLDAFGPAFALAKRVKIHPAILPSNALDKTRSNSTQFGGSNINSDGTMIVTHMSDYVVEDRILQVRDKCLKVYEDFRATFDQIRNYSAEASEGATTLRKELNGGDCNLEDLCELEKDADDGFHRIEQVTTQIAQVVKEDDPMHGLMECFSELAVLDDDSRERISCLIERKNWWLHYHVDALNRISHLQTLIPSINAEVQSLDDDLKTRTDSFRHLARLKDFVPAYALTVVEVVRRREYARHLTDYASALDNLISKLANDERRRRAAYRSEYYGKLPFVVEGLDENNVPTIEFETRSIRNGGATVAKTKDTQMAAADLPPLTRADVDQMAAAFRNIEGLPDDVLVDGFSPKAAAREVGLLIQKQFSRLEAMENAFALAVERFVMSDSESYPAGQPADPEEVMQLRARVNELQSIQENLTEQLRVESISSITASRKTQQETQIFIRKAEDLKLQLLSVKEEARHEKERLIQDQQSLITEIANHHDTVEKLSLQTTQLEDELKSRSKSLQDTERQLTSARATADDATRELHDLEARHRDHISDHEVVLNRLQQSRDRCKELEHELTESQSHIKILSSQIQDQNKLIDHQAADTEEDRLRMGKEIAELKSQLEDEKHQNSALLNQVTQQQIEIEHMSHQSKLLSEAHTAAESRWKDETTESNSRLENHCLKAVHALKSYQQVHRTVKDKIVNMPRPGSSQKPTTHNNQDSQLQTDGAARSDALAVTSPKPDFIKEEPLPSPSSAEFEALLHSLLQFDYDSLADVVHQKLDQLSVSIRKWMKDSKGYRERANRSQEQAQVKITFRDFAKGDLALFLPTRNPSAQVWAAFNVSFPHYFLQANVTVAPIIKSREWLVARIVSLTEKMVDPKDPETNPYQLPAGTRYFLLEVEPWSVEKSSRRLAQSISGGNNLSRPKMQNQMRSATLPSQNAPPNPSPLSTRRSLIGAEIKLDPTSSDIPQPDAADPKNSVPEANSPTTRTSELNIQANNPNSDLNQSEYTVIDRLSSLVGPELACDSPFRTTMNSPTQPPRTAPSGLSLSLKTYHKSPLGPASLSDKPPKAQPPCEADVLRGLDDSAAFRPSESSRPAFLASLSPTKLASATRKTPTSSSVQVPLKPRLRPVPKAHNASRSSSRAPSVSSSANLNPVVKAMLNPASPLHKGSSTVSTTLTSMENNLSSPRPPSSKTREPDSLGSSGTMIQMMRPSLPNNSPSAGTSTAMNLTKRRISFPGSAHNASNKPMMMIGAASGTASSQNSNSSLSGSGLFIGNSPNTNHGIINKSDWGGGTPISPSFPNHSANITNSALTGSGFFGSWRKRKESSNQISTNLSSLTSTATPSGSKNVDINPSNNLNRPPNSNPHTNTGTSNSFAGASDLLKRFSNSHWS